MKAKRKHLLVVVVALFLLSAGSIFAAMNALVPLPVPSKMAPVSNDFLKDASFIGAKACQECHQKEDQVWSDTWHAKMLRKISPEIVVADFNNLEIAYADVEVLDANKQKVKISPAISLKKEGDDYFLTLVDKDNEANNQTYRLAYVLGGNWEQQFEAQVGATL
jgi:hypothetical protein